MDVLLAPVTDQLVGNKHRFRVGIQLIQLAGVDIHHRVHPYHSRLLRRQAHGHLERGTGIKDLDQLIFRTVNTHQDLGERHAVLHLAPTQLLQSRQGPDRQVGSFGVDDVQVRVGLHQVLGDLERRVGALAGVHAAKIRGVRGDAHDTLVERIGSAHGDPFMLRPADGDEDDGFVGVSCNPLLSSDPAHLFGNLRLTRHDMRNRHIGDLVEVRGDHHIVFQGFLGGRADGFTLPDVQ